MRIISEHELGNRLGSLTETVTPSRGLRQLVAHHAGTRDRGREHRDLPPVHLGLGPPGNVTSERAPRDTLCWAGHAHSSALDYIPMRLSLVPRLFAISRQPDVVARSHLDARAGKVSLGIEVNVLPAALEVARARGALVSRSSTRACLTPSAREIYDEHDRSRHRGRRAHTDCADALTRRRTAARSVST